VDQVKYRGYLIYLIAASDLWSTPSTKAGWRFSAVPLAPDLPILHRSLSQLFGSREEALSIVHELIKPKGTNLNCIDLSRRQRKPEAPMLNAWRASSGGLSEARVSPLWRFGWDWLQLAVNFHRVYPGH
jgi:hypothetical protein